MNFMRVPVNCDHELVPVPPSPLAWKFYLSRTTTLYRMRSSLILFVMSYNNRECISRGHLVSCALFNNSKTVIECKIAPQNIKTGCLTILATFSQREKIDHEDDVKK